MKTRQTNVFQYAELSDDAKAKARDWYREGVSTDSDFANHVIEDAATCADMLGINLRTRPVRLMNGMRRLEAAVYWPGFSSQGDGACYEGSWSAHNVSAAKLKEHAPTDKELHRLTDAFADIAEVYPAASATVRHSGHYNHSGCMTIECESGVEFSDDTDDTVTSKLQEDFPDDDLVQLLRDFADWIYRQLELAYEWENSDENVADTIELNEYEFTEEGERA